MATVYSKSNWVPTETTIASYTFDSSVEGFTATGTGASFVRQTSVVRAGAGAAQWTTGSGGTTARSPVIAVQPNTAYRLSYYDYRATGTGTLGGGFVFQTTSSSYAGNNPTAAWTERVPTPKFHSTAEVVTITFGGLANNSMYVDDVRLIKLDYDGWSTHTTDPSSSGSGLGTSAGTSVSLGFGETTASRTNATLKRTISGLTVGVEHTVTVTANVSNGSQWFGQVFSVGVTGKGSTSYTTVNGSVFTVNYTFTPTSTSHEVFVTTEKGTATYAMAFLRSVAVSTPSPPVVTLNTRTDFNPGSAATFSWNYSDPDGNPQQKYRLIIKEGPGAVYDTGEVVGTATSRSVPGGTLQRGRSYSWTVQVWDSTGLTTTSATGNFNTLNAAPNAPVLTPKASFYAALFSGNFTWTFSDPDPGDLQTAYQFVVKQGASTVYDSGKVSSSGSAVSFASNSFTAGVTYNWTVRTWDTGDAVGPYATAQNFTPLNNPPLVAVVPVGTFDAALNKTFSWSFVDWDTGDLQSAYRLIIKQGASTAYDSGSIAGTATSRVIPAGTLNPATTYTWTVSVTDTRGPATTTSVADTFTTNAAPTPATLTPVGTVVADATNNFSWTFNDPDVLTALDNRFDLEDDQEGWTTNADQIGVWDGYMNFWANIIGPGQPISAYKTITGLTVGRVYTAKALVEAYSDAGSMNLGVTGIGTSAPVAVTGLWDGWKTLTYTFTATATSHQLVVSGSTPGAYADLLLESASVTTPDTQSARQVIIQTANGSTVVHDTGKVASTSSSYSLPAGTLAKGTSYRWAVYTWDSFDYISPLSNWSTFATAADIAVTITSPAEGTVLETNAVTVNWTTFAPDGSTQTQRRVRVVRLTDSVVHSDTGMQATGSKTFNVTGLASGHSYRIEVSVLSSVGVLSEVAEVTIVSDYANPNKPTAVVDAMGPFIRITVTNPPRTGLRPAVSYNEVYRRAPGGVSELIATVDVDGSYDDYLVAPSGDYTYFIRAVSA